jgi:hypothetical protein
LKTQGVVDDHKTTATDAVVGAGHDGDRIRNRGRAVSRKTGGYGERKCFGSHAFLEREVKDDFIITKIFFFGFIYKSSTHHTLWSRLNSSLRVEGDENKK